MRWITRVLASLTLAMAACAPPVASRPTTPVANAIPTPSVAPSVVAAPVEVIQANASPSAVAGAEVKIIEPPFRPPQEWTYTPAELSVKVGMTVVWTNTGAVAHTVMSDDGKSFDSGSIDPKALLQAHAGGGRNVRLSL